MGIDKAMQAFAARLDTFHTAHQLSKRRASAQNARKKGAANTIEWPHQQPTPEDLARAGFFYRPAQDSIDNVQCFSCAVKLDGWEPSDEPVREHLAHSDLCAWARSLCAGLDTENSQATNPMSEELVDARRGTFVSDDGEVSWPHEGKRGWKCKIAKMVDAGWCWDPAPTTDVDAGDGDGVTCFYCNLSLDGWEPKDDPMEEHKRRSPDCAFFALIDATGSGKGKKGKSRIKAGGRTSAASKASRMSAQSVVSVMSDAFSLPADAVIEEVRVGADDSTLTVTAAESSSAAAAKDKKTSSGKKAAAKGSKGRKRTDTVDYRAGTPEARLLPDLATEVPAPLVAAEPARERATKSKKGVRHSKQQVEPSALEPGAIDVASGKKPSHKLQESVVDLATSDEVDFSEVSAQLQEELEHTLDLSLSEDGDSAVHLALKMSKATRGIKRTSDGARKVSGESSTSALLIEFPVPPVHAANPTKPKKGRNTSKQATSIIPGSCEAPTSVGISNEVSITDLALESSVPQKTKGKTRAKGGKSSSVRSSRSSRATVTANSGQEDLEEEDLARDEREIEEELRRIAAEQAVQEYAAEFEGSPSQTTKEGTAARPVHPSHVQEQQTRISNSKPLPSSPPASRLLASNATPSPSTSDKENQPSSIIHPSAKATSAHLTSRSATKLTRIPLAPGTPKHNLQLSPSKRLVLSPSKQIRGLHSTVSWEPVDLDSVTLLTSPQQALTPGSLAQRLASAAVQGALLSPEKGLTVEEWIQLQAEKGEQNLRRQCEEMVGLFEAEGNRAMAVVGGVVVA